MILLQSSDETKRPKYDMIKELTRAKTQPYPDGNKARKRVFKPEKKTIFIYVLKLKNKKKNKKRKRNNAVQIKSAEKSNSAVFNKCMQSNLGVSVKIIITFKSEAVIGLNSFFLSSQWLYFN